jgi:glycosyltransferase involved in cell wall biosynthesis
MQSKRSSSILSDLSSNNPTITVVVPMRNEAPQVDACLDSLARVAYEPVEFLIVDDRSSDETRERCESWIEAQGDPRFTLLIVPGEPPMGWVGKAFATDYAIRHGSGALVLIADADVRHGAQNMQESVDLLGSKDMLVRLPFVPARHLGSVLVSFLLETIWVASHVARAVGGLPLSFGAYVLMRRTFYEQVGGFDAHRSFPESLPLARLAARQGMYRLRHPSPAVIAELYPSFGMAVRGTLRNINFGLVSPAALFSAFIFISWPLCMLGLFPSPYAVAGLLLWGAGLFTYERSCGRSWRGAVLLAVVGPCSAAVLAGISCAALARRIFGLSVEWRGRRMRVQ